MPDRKKPAVRTPLSKWLGGKFLLARKLAALVPDHVCYCEPFCGAAWLLFAKARSRVEVLNDLNGDVVNTFRVIHDQPAAFLEKFRYMLISRAEFYRLRAMDPTALDDVSRAARFFYLLKLSFGGKMFPRPCYGYNKRGRVYLRMDILPDLIMPAWERLRLVNIENLPWEKCIELYDAERTFFYIDPPYWGFEDSYGKDMFRREDFRKLADTLKNIRGRFLLSLSDVPETRAMFADFRIREIRTKYSLNFGYDKSVGELLIHNYDLPATLPDEEKI